jgi:2-isopropylmalate synthase
LQALVSDVVTTEDERVSLVALRVCSETGETPVASITLSVDGQEVKTEQQGSGPVDAAFKAIEHLVVSDTELQIYSVSNITNGTDAQADVNVRLEKGGRIVSGQGTDTDIVIASAKAYINALNKILAPVERAHPQV